MRLDQLTHSGRSDYLQNYNFGAVPGKLKSAELSEAGELDDEPDDKELSVSVMTFSAARMACCAA